jgi:hypothetical protein
MHGAAQLQGLEPPAGRERQRFFNVNRRYWRVNTPNREGRQQCLWRAETSQGFKSHGFKPHGFKPHGFSDELVRTGLSQPALARPVVHRPSREKG